MTLRLILTRHAKSSWDMPATGDHDRPLNARGREAAQAIGQWLADNGYAPDLVLSSDAARTRETWALMAASFATAPKVEWIADLYHASAKTMLNVLRAGGGDAKSVLMLGHNPGIAGFAGMLVETPPANPRFRDYPTAATTVMDFAVENWRAADWGGGTVVDFVVPKEI
ncbi:MAG: histidine phosphatase family protein [Rhodobacter sp.]|nr:histidine phosphatase family protein [Rhodobacter sp.]